MSNNSRSSILRYFEDKADEDSQSALTDMRESFMSSEKFFAGTRATMCLGKSFPSSPEKSL